MQETSDRILKVARAIANLAGKEQIESEHISEAIQTGRWIGSSGFDSPG